MADANFGMRAVSPAGPSPGLSRNSRRQLVTRRSRATEYKQKRSNFSIAESIIVAEDPLLPLSASALGADFGTSPQLLLAQAEEVPRVLVILLP